MKKETLLYIYELIDYAIREFQTLMVNITPFFFYVTFILLISFHEEEVPYIFFFMVKFSGYLLFMWLINRKVRRLLKIRE